jgi:TATA-binding protein-associated factor Taf7
MARRSLKPQLNQIRAWVRQGRTDAWIAHQLEVSTSELREFRKQHGFTADEEDGSQEIDLRDEIEAEIEAATAEEEAAREEEGDEPAEDAEEGPDDDDGDGDEGEDRPKPRRRRRGRRGGRGRRKELEATFDHGETDGYGLWLDASVKDNPIYSEHWAGQREVTVRIDPDQIVIRRPASSDGDADDDS